MWRYLIVLACAAVTATHGQLRFFVPQTPCADKFDYQQYGKRAYKGHVTVPSPAPGMDLVVEVHLYVDAVVPRNNPGNISLTYGVDFNRRKIAAEDIENIEYDVHFSTLNPLPEVDKIVVNGETICEGPLILNPTSRLKLKHTLQPRGRQTTTTSTPPSTDECGLTASSAPLVINGTRTARGEWPWLAAVYDKEDGELFLCGGSLINRKHVITAAHCIKLQRLGVLTTRTKDDVVVVLGRYELGNRWERFVEPRVVEAIHLPNAYDPVQYYFDDIAVLVLASAVEYNEFIRPICLWSSDQNAEKVINKIGTVVGWGRTENETLTNTPKKAHVLIVSRDDCIASFQLLRLYTNERTLCAGFRDGKGPCSGDSGGPMMVPETERGGRVRWYLTGIVSNSIYDNVNEVCNLRQYTVYTDVVKHLAWLGPFIRQN